MLRSVAVVNFCKRRNQLTSVISQFAHTLTEFIIFRIIYWNKKIKLKYKTSKFTRNRIYNANIDVRVVRRECCKREGRIRNQFSWVCFTFLKKHNINKVKASHKIEDMNFQCHTWLQWYNICQERWETILRHRQCCLFF